MTRDHSLVMSNNSRFCANCGTKLSRTAVTCYQCGRPVSDLAAIKKWEERETAHPIVHKNSRIEPPLDAYIKQLRTATDRQKRVEAAEALGELGDTSAIGPLREALDNDESLSVTAAAAHSLRKLRGPGGEKKTSVATRTCPNCGIKLSVTTDVCYKCLNKVSESEKKARDEAKRYRPQLLAMLLMCAGLIVALAIFHDSFIGFVYAFVYIILAAMLVYAVFPRKPWVTELDEKNEAGVIAVFVAVTFAIAYFLINAGSVMVGPPQNAPSSQPFGEGGYYLAQLIGAGIASIILGIVAAVPAYVTTLLTLRVRKKSQLK